VATVAEAFALALQHLQAGHPHQAEQLCRRILQADPGHADTHHLLGLLANQGQGRLEEAVAHFRQALHFRPDFPEAHSNLGNVFFLKEDLDNAVAHYRHALRLKPDYLEAHNNLGLALAGKGELVEAIDHYRQALRLNSNSAETYSNLGNALLERGELEEAVQCFQHALRLKPDYVKAHYNLGVALQRQDHLDEAIGCFQQALRLQPNMAEAHCNLGLALEGQDKLDEAIRCYRQALQFKPNYAEACNSLGLALERQDKMDEALQCYQQALQIKPNSVEPRTNLGNVHWDQGRFDEALACYEQALRWHPEAPETHFNRARLRLLQGDWAMGWPEYEWRWQTKECPGFSFPQPRWDGTPLAGRTILLLAEQGLGDTLHFIRYCPLVKRLGGTVIVECQPALLRLLASVEGIDVLLARGLPPPAFHVYASLLSLPGLFHTTLANVPHAVPYLHADAELVAHWRQELRKSSMCDVRCAMSEEPHLTSHIAHRTSHIRVGIAWQGNPAVVGDRHRSIPLARFAPLAQVEGVQLISLQKGPGSEQLYPPPFPPPSGERETWWAGQFPVLNLGERLDEGTGAFMDTAAVMKNLDLVITSDTSIAHLAGALGVRVWVPLTLIPDWRWMLQREDSPWYPTMRLFRQTRRGCWEDVFERMAEELKAVAGCQLAEKELLANDRRQGGSV